MIRDSGKEIALLGVDADVFETDPIGRRPAADLDPARRIDVGVHDAVLAAGNGDFDTAPFIGTLENEGVGLAPFHDFESQGLARPAGRARRRSQAGIIDGSIPVTSYLAG